MNQLSIVIPVLNQWNLTEACLQSLAANTPGRFFSVVVVDNNSTDDTPRNCPALLEELFPGRHSYLRQEQNLNFGPACNLGAAALEAQYLFFLNNDTEVMPGWAAPLFKALREDDRLGAVSSLLLYPDSRRVQHVGVAFDANRHLMHLFEGFPAKHPAVIRSRRVQAISAAALFMPRELFMECGGFYEGYQNGSEDTDLCCQLLRKEKRVACVPESIVLHHTSRTEGRFDNVSGNAKLLDERCRSCFSSDLHRHARREGFEVRLTDWLEPYLVGPEPEPGPEPELEPGETGDLSDQLEAYPLWEQGYDLIVKKLKAEGRTEEAFTWQDLAARFFPELIAFQHAADLAQEAGRPGHVQLWQDRHAIARAALKDQGKLAFRARENRDWFQEIGEADLVALYVQWLKKNI